jgi:GNAT superfamily N-acetyltransferase
MGCGQLPGARHLSDDGHLKTLDSRYLVWYCVRDGVPLQEDTLPIEIICRPMAPGEHLAVGQLVERVFRHDVAPLYADEGVREFLTYATADKILDRSGRDHQVLVAMTDDALIGIIEIRHCDHISLFFIDPSYQRGGVGRKLLACALACCREHRPDVEQVTVNSSPNAVEAYLRFGFRATGPLQAKNGIGFVPMTLELRHEKGV